MISSSVRLPSAWPREYPRPSEKKSIAWRRFSIRGIQRARSAFWKRSHEDRGASRELSDVLSAYEYWERRTGGLSCRFVPQALILPRNVDALGKAYIIDRAAAAARKAWPSIEGAAARYRRRHRGVGPVLRDRDRRSGAPATTTADRLRRSIFANAAVATSGTYARGAHLIDSRSGQSIVTPVAATVVAADAVTANALATTLCLTSAEEGLRLVEATPGAEGLRIASGRADANVGLCSSGAAGQCSNARRRTVACSHELAGWIPGHDQPPLTSGRSMKRPYMAVWVEDSSNKLVRVLAIWAGKSKY